MRFKARTKPSVLNRIKNIFFSPREKFKGNWTMFTSLIAFRDIKLTDVMNHIKRSLWNWRWTWLWICIIFQYRYWCIELKTIVLEHKARIVIYFVIITNNQLWQCLTIRISGNNAKLFALEFVVDFIKP